MILLLQFSLTSSSALFFVLNPELLEPLSCIFPSLLNARKLRMDDSSSDDRTFMRQRSEFRSL